MKNPTASGHDAAESFPHLPQAPIVEAVIHWQAPAGKRVDQASLKDELKKRFPAFECRIQHEIQAKVTISPDRTEPETQLARWDGFRLTGTGDFDHYVVQIKSNGIVFSRLAPYNDWTTFVAAAMPFWNFFSQRQRPPLIERLGVRFINKIALSRGKTASAYIKDICRPPKNFDFVQEEFFHQDRFSMRERPYQVNWIRTVQPSAAGEKVLIIDIDVATGHVFVGDEMELATRLKEMRVIKNKLFFSRLTNKALKEFQRS